MGYINHKLYMQSPEWKLKRNQRLIIDNRKCTRCGKKSDLQVHHLHYKTFGNENPETDLITLCSFCHFLNHEIENELKEIAEICK